MCLSEILSVSEWKTDGQGNQEAGSILRRLCRSMPTPKVYILIRPAADCSSMPGPKHITYVTDHCRKLFFEI